MTGGLEYHKDVRPSFSPSVAFLSTLAISLLLGLPAAAQINGAPSSVTSPGFGGRAVNGPRSSVTSLGPQGYAPPIRPRPPLSTAGNGSDHRGDHDGHHRHHRDDNFTSPVWYAVPVPYAVDNAVEYSGDDQPDEADADANYQGGPTVFDRRGSGAGSYVPPARDPAPAHALQPAQEAAPAVDPDPPLPPTLLVFKDGRTVEVANYAILGATLFDLTSGHRRKIPIMDLDLEATRKQNDERGVTFQLPQSVQAN